MKNMLARRLIYMKEKPQLFVINAQEICNCPKQLTYSGEQRLSSIPGKKHHSFVSTPSSVLKAKSFCSSEKRSAFVSYPFCFLL